MPGLYVGVANFSKVLRWSALAVGIFYGFSHQRSITAQNHAAHAQAEWKHKEDLIQKAKLEWKKKQNPGAFTKGDDGGMLRTPDSTARTLDHANTSQWLAIPRTRTLTWKHFYKRSPPTTRNEHDHSLGTSSIDLHPDALVRVPRYAGIEPNEKSVAVRRLEGMALILMALQKSIGHKQTVKCVLFRPVRPGSPCIYPELWQDMCLYNNTTTTTGNKFL